MYFFPVKIAATVRVSSDALCSLRYKSQHNVYCTIFRPYSLLFQASYTVLRKIAGGKEKSDGCTETGGHGCLLHSGKIWLIPWEQRAVMEHKSPPCIDACMYTHS